METSAVSRQGREPGYRWVVLAAAAVMLCIVMGQLVNGLSVYFIPLEQAFGWPRGDIALVNSMGLVGVAAGGIVVGRVVDTLGTRRVVLVAVVVFSACVMLASRAHALWQLYALFLVAGFVGGGAMFAPVIALVGNWFRSGAGLAIGIASAGQAVGQGGVPFGAAHLIDALGWRGALFTEGLLSLVLLLPMAWLLRDPPAAPGTPGAAAAASEPPLPPSVAVPWLALAGLGCCICMSVPLMHLVPLIQGRGIEAASASSVLFVMLLVAIAGRVAFGRLADRIGALPTYMLASLWQTVLVFFFTQLHSLAGFYGFAVVYGFGYAGVMTAVLVTARALTPPERRASLMGIILAFGWLGHGIGGLQAGMLYDLTGAYTAGYATAAFAGMVNLSLLVALLWTLQRRRLVPVRI